MPGCGLTGPGLDTMAGSVRTALVIAIALQHGLAVGERGVEMTPFVWARKTVSALKEKTNETPLRWDIQNIRRVGIQKKPLIDTIKDNNKKRQPFVQHEYSNGVSRTTLLNGQNYQHSSP